MGGNEKYSMTGDKFSNSHEKMRHSVIGTPSKRRFEKIIEQPDMGNSEVLNDIKSQLSLLLNKKDTEKRKSKDREHYKDQINQLKFTICELE